jgi:hypothetical protein
MNRLLSFCLATAYHSRNRASVLLFVLAIVCGADRCKLHAANYTFTSIADNSTAAPVGTLSALSAPTISNGVVAFKAQYAGGTLDGIFKGSGGPVTTIVKEGDAAPQGVFTSLENPSISGGQVAFVADYDVGNRGVFVGNGAALTTIAKTGDAAPVGMFTTFRNALIDGDYVAFFAGSTSATGFYVAKEGTITTIVKTGDIGPAGQPFTILAQPAMSGGNVAFHARYSSSNGVFVGNGGPLTTIVKTGDPAPVGTFTGGGFAMISGDTVAFNSNYGSMGGPVTRGVFLGDGGPISAALAREGDPAPIGTLDSLVTSGFDGTTTVMSGFYGGLSHLGIFVHKNGSLSTLITDGDMLFGSSVTGVTIARGGLDPDGSGRITFSYGLANGRSGIAVAIPVPEPSTTVTMIAMLCCGLLIRSRRGPNRTQRAPDRKRILNGPS